MTLRQLDLGDLMVIGEAPPKFIKAMAVLSKYLGEVLGEQSRVVHDHVKYRSPDQYKRSCILCSLTVRRFLFRIGYTDAELTPCMAIIRAADAADNTIHTLGIGDPNAKRPRQATDTGWPGHMVVRVPSIRYLVDTTLFPAKRPQWPELPGMIAAPLLSPETDLKMWGMPAMAGVETRRDDGGRQEMAWLDQPDNRGWRVAPDYARRRTWEGAGDQLVAKFGPWED